MAEVSLDLSTLTCPGCHFGCKLSKYQCSRGKEFHDLAAAGEEVPERRWPMFTPSEIAAGRDKQAMPINNKLMFAMKSLSKALRTHEETGIRKVALGLMRLGEFLSVPILAKRMKMTPEELGGFLEEGVSQGLFVIYDEPVTGRVASLTDAGKQQAQAWAEEGDARTAEFLAPLTDDEKEQLESLLMKLNLDRRRK